MVGVAIGKVITHRLLVSNAPRCISTMTVGGVSQAHFGIEEVVIAINIESCGSTYIPVVVVADTLDGIADMAVLQVNIAVEALGDINIGASEDVGIELAAHIIIILLQGIEVAHIVAHPSHITEVIATVPIHSATKHGIYATARVVEVEHTATEVVVIVFEANEVALVNFVAGSIDKRLQAILNESATGLVLIVTAVTLVVVEGEVERPLVVEAV